MGARLLHIDTFAHNRSGIAYQDKTHTVDIWQVTGARFEECAGHKSRRICLYVTPRTQGEAASVEFFFVSNLSGVAF
jgi:hypothetical protein